MRHLVVDGYNVISHDPDYSLSWRRSRDEARARLVEEVAAYAAGEYRATIVFDGSGNPASDGTPHHIAGVAVMFSPYGKDADGVIEALVHRARERGEETVVVTSDANVQWTVMRGGITRMSSPELVREMRARAQDWREHTPEGDARGRVEDRVDEATRDALWRWARGS